MSMVLYSLLILSASPPAIDTAVVCPVEFRAALEPWVRHRQTQGRRIVFLENTQSANAIRQQIQTLAGESDLSAVLLVGDAAPTVTETTDIRSRLTPTHYVKAKVNIHWGSEEQIATDNPYADLDGDHLPDLAVGRLAADSPAELSIMVRKILAYENNTDMGPWRRNINVVAGVGGFGALADTVLETATKKFMVEGIPAGYHTSMTFAGWKSPFCPDPRNFQEAALYRLNQGCLFWVYIGHGNRTHLDYVRTPGGDFPIMSNRDARRFSAQAGAPIALFLACYTGAYDYKHDCLAEEMLRSPLGPIAAISGSRVTMPYGMTLLANEMLKQYFEEDQQSLGQVLQLAKRGIVEAEADDPNRQLIDTVAAVISPKKDLLDEERVEHLSLFNLLGDPLLRVRPPQSVSVKATDRVAAGEVLEISGAAPIGGRCTFELVCQRGRTKFRPPLRSDFAQADLASFDGVYRRANDSTYVMHQVDVQPGEFQASLRVPIEAKGPCNIRVYIQGQRTHALGAADIYVSRLSSNRTSNTSQP